MPTIDVPAITDGYNHGAGGTLIESLGNQTTGISSTSSSSAADENQFDSHHTTTLAALEALAVAQGKPAIGSISNISSAAFLIRPTACTNNGPEGWFLQTFFAAGGFGAADWNNPNSALAVISYFAQVAAGGWAVGQYQSIPLPLASVNFNGDTDIQIVCNAGDTPGGSATFMTKENAANQPPLIRFTYTPTVAPSTPANDVRQSLSSLLAARLRGVSMFHNRVYQHEPSSLIGYPTCAVISAGFFDDVVSQIYDVRTYLFTIIVWANLGKQSRDRNDGIRRRTEDAIFAVLDNYQDFGGNVLWSKPQSAGWGYAVDPGIGYLMINIEAKKQRVMSFS